MPMRSIFDTLTRTKLLLIWFMTVIVASAAAVVLGAHVTMGTGVLLSGLALVPPVIMWMLWPGARSLTAGDVLRGTDPRN
jgi:hypothetical protein